ncbi:hypothetical protein Goshw_014077 [Gossypium schwendimanii]|uniref:Uncharacterized protein n=1 Tax=Gossypium schwendimanii TaxID=34291 RepID=A0A7J9L396_GOSSC|nr:hypothetical protein [Gossypium schwendimanii]
MKRCVSGKKVEIFFSHLVRTLCKNVEVPMEENEQFMRPTKNLIAPNYPPDMFGSIQTCHREEEKGSDEREDRGKEGEKAGDEEMDYKDEEDD